MRTESDMSLLHHTIDHLKVQMEGKLFVLGVSPGSMTRASASC